jgi:hypothetical protein
MRIGVGLSIPELSTRGGRFSPAALFADGAKGVWYAPDDFSTLFQDSAGTTPVTAVEQPVGLMLDKSQGLVLGSELVTGAASAYSGNGTVTTVGDTVTATCTTNGIYGITWASTSVSNLWVLFTVEVVTNSASKSLLIFPNALSTALGATTTTGNKSYISFAPTATGSNARPIFYINGLIGESFSVRLVSIKSYAGNHASQATTASRPVLRARYNLLTYSEQFDNGAWTKTNVTVTANTSGTTDPLGGNTADALFETTATGFHRAIYSQTALAGTYAFSCYVKTNGGRNVNVEINVGSPGVYASFDLTTGTLSLSGAYGTGASLVGTPTISNEGNGWYRCVLIGTLPAGTFQTWIGAINGPNNSYAGDVTKGLYVWGADLRTGSSAGTYQRIAAATDYATAGFLPYLALVTDDSMATGSIDFSATDKMFVCAGITKNSDAETGTVCDLNGVTATGAFMLRAPSGALANYAFFSGGTAGFSGATATPYAAPITNVVSCIGDISGDREIIRVNGVQAAINTGNQGTGNYSNLPLYIGRRQGSALPLNGRIYQLIVVGKTLSASELASTEAFVATYTGVTL